MKGLRNTLLSFLGLILLYLVLAFCLSRITVNKNQPADGTVQIYIKSNGVHTDIVVPVKNEQMDWSRQIRYANTEANDSSLQWLGIGWGDKAFYLQTPQWKDLTFGVAFRAAFGLGESAMHATYYADMNETKRCKKIMITKEAYGKLVNYIDSGFAKNETGDIGYIDTDANYGKNDALYEGVGTYSLFTTCNSWANAALKKSGLKACLWTAFDRPIFLKYKSDGE